MTSEKPCVLIVEDIPSLASYAAFLNREPVDVHIVHDGKDALAFFKSHLVAVAIVDIGLPDISGLNILKSLHAVSSSTKIIVITAEGSVNLAVEAMRQGAADFVVKPCSRERLSTAVQNALKQFTFENPVSSRKEKTGKDAPGRFIGQSSAIQESYRILRSAGPTNATVFVTGESGVGKELCAEALHMLSKRRDKPFVAVNCAAIPKDLMESEIFGHVKGAFTSASRDRKGAVMQADGGTLFLDEIAEMDLSLQSKLLRFLQEKTLQRVGEDHLRQADVRIVCATNRNPLTEVAAGRFREDLFYRLHVVPLELPPLRDRGPDILLLAQHFLDVFSREDKREFTDFTPKAKSILLHYPWPGNVRQLQNTIRSIVVLNQGILVTPDMLPSHMRAKAEPIPTLKKPRIEKPAITPDPCPSDIEPLDDVIRKAIESAISICSGSIPRAAEALQISSSTIYRRMEIWQGVETAKPKLSVSGS